VAAQISQLGILIVVIGAKPKLAPNGRLFARLPSGLPITLRDQLGRRHRRIKPQQVSRRTGTWAFLRAIWPRSARGATYLNAT
jgi:hypothetical protein